MPLQYKTWEEFMYEIFFLMFPSQTKILAPPLLSPPNIRVQETPWRKVICSIGERESDAGSESERKIYLCFPISCNIITNVPENWGLAIDLANKLGGMGTWAMGLCSSCHDSWWPDANDVEFNKLAFPEFVSLQSVWPICYQTCFRNTKYCKPIFLFRQIPWWNIFDNQNMLGKRILLAIYIYVCPICCTVNVREPLLLYTSFILI